MNHPKKKLPARVKIKPFTETQKKQWGQFKQERSIPLSPEQIEYICEFYAEVFQKPIWRPKKKGSHQPLIKMIDNLDIAHNQNPQPNGDI